MPQKNKEVRSSTFAFTEDLTLVSYVPAKREAILALSSMHIGKNLNEKSGTKNLPEILATYNATKGGVDTCDYMCSVYNVGRRTNRWPIAIFHHLVNVAAINGLVIYRENHPDKK